MWPRELEAFLEGRPTGAICFDDDSGALVALPAAVVDGSVQGGELHVYVAGTACTSRDFPACLVADSFTSYAAIRGVIAQGAVSSATAGVHADTLVWLRLNRVRTFSFADAV
ncbi:UNVERIFIED_CONTAM: hypothetical protein K7Z70_20380 [Mycobacterium avium subsp. hominissuis]